MNLCQQIFKECLYEANCLSHEVPKKWTTKFTSADFQKSVLRESILRIKRFEGNSVDPDEVADYEPPHLAVHCLQIYLFSFLGFKCK